MKKILIISGPTASGKTDFAIECAKRFNGEIISADSMQIYKNLDIGTAKATFEEQSQAVHHLLDIVEPNGEFSVQQFVEKASSAIEDIFHRGKLPILVGGTALYIKSLIQPYSFCSAPKNEQIRAKYLKILEEKGKEFLYNILLEKDPIACSKIHMNDTKRVIRALEICESNTQNKTELNAVDSNIPRYDSVFVILNLPREELYERINERVDKMFSLGLLNEVESLLKAHKIDQTCQSMQAIGYKELFQYFDKSLTLDETKDLIKKHSRNYAKRQITFLKSFKNAIWFNPKTQREEALLFVKENLI